MMATRVQAAAAAAAAVVMMRAVAAVVMMRAVAAAVRMRAAAAAVRMRRRRNNAVTYAPAPPAPRAPAPPTLAVAVVAVAAVVAAAAATAAAAAAAAARKRKTAILRAAALCHLSNCPSSLLHVGVVGHWGWSYGTWHLPSTCDLPHNTTAHFATLPPPSQTTLQLPTWHQQ